MSQQHALAVMKANHKQGCIKEKPSQQGKEIGYFPAFSILDTILEYCAVLCPTMQEISTRCNVSSGGRCDCQGPGAQNTQGKPQEVGLVQPTKEKAKMGSNCGLHYLMQQGIERIERLLLETHNKQEVKV